MRKKEFNQMSRRTGIGASWLQKYATDINNIGGKVIVRGHKTNPPRYYDKNNPDREAVEDQKYARLLESIAQQEHHTPERLAVQESVQAAKEKLLKRNKI